MNPALPKTRRSSITKKSWGSLPLPKNIHRLSDKRKGGVNFTQLMKKVKFDRQGLIPAIIQDSKTDKVLMLAFMNRQALRKTLESGKTYFWSRSRKKVWRKGESSGHIQSVQDIFLDCDGDTLLIKVKQVKAACHTGYYSCFYRRLNPRTKGLKVVGKKIFDPKKIYHK